MINRTSIFHGSKTGNGLKVVSTNKTKGLEPVQTKSKKGGSCNKKCNKKRIKGSGLKILK